MTDKQFPLYPELSEQGKIEAQEILNDFADKIRKVIYDTVEYCIDNFYSDIIPYIESDSWSNFRNEIMDGFKNYNNCKIQAEYDFKDIRQQIYKEYRDDIIKDLNQDLLEENKKLKERIEWLNKIR
jgi:uncharacterized protein CbrC (UPF0167 family)